MTRAAAPFSILFPDPSAGPVPGDDRDWPEHLADLNLDQVFEVITAARREYELAPFLRSPLRDERSVAFRHAVFRDLESGLARPLEDFAARMRRMRSYLAAASQRRHRYERAAWFLDAGRIYCQAIAALREALERARPASEGLRRCQAYLESCVRSEGFRDLRTVTDRLAEQLAAIRYGVRVHGGQVTVSEYHGEADYSAEVLATFEKFQSGETKSRLEEFGHDFHNHVQELIVDRVALLHPELFHSLLAYREAHADLVDPMVSRFDREVQLYLGYLSAIEPVRAAGYPFCYPEVSSTTKEVRVSETFDLALARKLVVDRRPVVLNDIELGGGERIAVISGPNQGGKTTFARTFGQLHQLAALGFPVPGSTGRVFLSDRILTHFAKQEEVEDLHSSLEQELLRVRAMLERVTPRSVVIMNEGFASTTSDDQLYLGREIIGRLISVDALSVYVTFIDELSRLGPSIVSMMSTVRPDHPAERTFKVIRKPADGRAYAMVVAQAHGLTYAAITDRVRP